MTGRREPVITIDGPAGAGKSTTAREVARRLGFKLVDTGALYRALAWALLQAGASPEDEAGVGALLARADVQREVAPLRKPEGAMTVDSTSLSPEAVVQQILEMVEQARCCTGS